MPSRLNSLALATTLFFSGAGPALAQQPGALAETNTQTESAPENVLSDPSEAQANDPVLNAQSDAAKLSRFKLGQARGEWAGLLAEHVPELSSAAEAQTLTPGLLRRLRTEISSILATEGYFSPHIRFERAADDASLIRVNVEAGARTVVQQVNLTFSGALADAAAAGQVAAQQRRAALIANWSLPQKQPFRDKQWREAKEQLLDSLRADLYAAATISDSRASIDAGKSSASLELEVNSGPPFTLGEMKVSGLQRYPSWLLEKYAPPKKGETYSRARLLEFQRALQNSAYFSTVAVSIDPDFVPAGVVPLEVNVVERASSDLGFGVGYSTNTGFRSEVSYRDRHVLKRAWDVRSAFRLEQKRQLAYADIYLPPRSSDQLDSFGVLTDRLDVSGLAQTRSAIGVKRTQKRLLRRGHLEQRLGVNFSVEKNQLDGEEQRSSKALVGTVGWTWRVVDDSFAPRQGQIAQVDFAFSEKTLGSDRRFIRSYGKYQRWIPVGKQDSMVLRAELGKVLSPNVDGIPEDYLFRTGGSSTLRGYAYQSLGVQHPAGVSGGRVLAVASAEYVHSLDADWAAAGFVDVGDAAENWSSYRAKQAFGVGARYKTLAGPIAVDLAYAKATRRLRLDVSIAIAF